MGWTLLIVLLVACGAFAILDAPARARRHAAERRAVLHALAALRAAGTPASTAQALARRAGGSLTQRVIRAHLAALEEDGLVAVQARGDARRAEPLYRLLADPPPEPARGEPRALTVYHDGACPLCAAEIAHYRRARGATALRFVDVAAPTAAPGENLTREAALARFHVRDAQGGLVAGAAAFALLWQTLPGWRWLGRIVGTWPILPLAERAYRAFLPLRPFLARVLVRTGLIAPPPAR